MFEKEAFQKSFFLELTSAIIGIHKEKWYNYENGMSPQEVKIIMIEKGYDIVPIENKNGQITSFFQLSRNTEYNLEVMDLTEQDKIYYLTHVRDAIYQLKNQNRTHFFLTNGRETNDVVGLLSLSNFNCREFYVYLFSLLSYVEREFATLIQSSEDIAIKTLYDLTTDSGAKKQIESIKNRIEVDRSNNIENDYKEYLYIHHLLWLIAEEKKYLNLGYKKRESFISGTGKLRELRNNIAHPVKSLVQNLEDLGNLELGLKKLYEFKECLDSRITPKSQTI